MQGLTRVFRVALVVLWVALLAHLLWAQRGGSSNTTPITGEGLPLTETDDLWMGLYLQDKKIGYSHERLAPDADGYRFEQESLLHLTVLGQPQTVNAVAWGRTRLDFALRSFAMSLQSGAGSLAAEGSVDDQGLSLTLHTGGETTHDQLPLHDPIYLPGNARLFIARSGLEPGREFTLRVFDPSAFGTHEMRVTVTGKEPLVVDGRTLDAWRVRETLHGVESQVWLDQSGRVLRETGPMGLTALRESSEQAVTGLDPGDAGLDLTTAVAIPVDKPLDGARDLQRLAVRLRGIDDVTIPSDHRQSVSDGLLTVERESASPDSFALPYRGAEWRPELQRTPFLQVDHPRVLATTAEILGGETDARRAAERLRTWVFRHLRKVPTASIPNALQVLDMKEGDCNEHAVLLAALARAAGLPARVVAGVVYVDGKFLYHAWNEVWLGSGWVSVDAALDQMPVDATHIKLVEGGPETHMALLPVMGRLKIEVVAAS